MRQGVVGNHHLQDQRHAAKDHGVPPRQRRQQSEAAELHPGQDQPQDQPAAEPEDGHFERDLDALEQIRQAEIVQKQRHQLTVRRPGSFRLSGSRPHFLSSASWSPDLWISTIAAITASRNLGLSLGTAMPTEYGIVTAIAFSSLSG